jgi:hypothetical protein
MVCVNEIRLNLGRLLSTPGALAALEEANQSPLEFIQRHQCGDWGNVCSEDAAENERSLSAGDRILSSYSLKTGTKIWIITEADRAATTVLLPEEY